MIQVLFNDKWRYQKVALSEEKILINDPTEEETHVIYSYLLTLQTRKASFTKAKHMIVHLHEVSAIHTNESKEPNWLPDIILPTVDSEQVVSFR